MLRSGAVASIPLIKALQLTLSFLFWFLQLTEALLLRLTVNSGGSSNSKFPTIFRCNSEFIFLADFNHSCIPLYLRIKRNKVPEKIQNLLGLKHSK
nr:hypothetical protein CFP56_19144 [Quercus suber]